MPANLISAIAATWLVLGLEWALVSVLCFGQFAGVVELQYGSLLLAPATLLMGAAGALVSVPIWRALRAAEQRRLRLALTLFACFSAAVVAFSVSTGRHFEQVSLRVLFVAAVSVAAAALTAWLAPLVARALVRRPLHCVIAVGLLCSLAELLNRFVLVRLYPGFHVTLAVFVVLLAPGLHGLRVPETRNGSRWASLGVLGVLVAALLSVVPASRRLAPLDNFRLVLTEQAPLLGRVVAIDAALAKWLLPQAQVVPVGEQKTEAASSAGNPIDLSGRDILLITIDALRADHVGAYGYPRPTTPSIDALAKDGIVFDAAYCPTPNTSYSVSSLLTGKYLRPLLLQGVGQDSLTMAEMLRVYGYATAAFYPPAVFFIDGARFTSFEQGGLGFEYRKAEFAEGDQRVLQVGQYLKGVPKERRAFVWVHLFSPHEPYEQHAGYNFGERDIDRYDSEVAFTDATVGKLVALARARDPKAIVIATADHGEEFGEHGGRYHGSSVYEEQVRVPLVVSIPGHAAHGRVADPVQTIDLFTTLLTGLKIPISPRVRGRDLGAALANPAQPRAGFAFAETDDFTLLAERSSRLICQRRIDACQLFNLKIDPGEQHAVTDANPQLMTALRSELQQLNATHGQYEQAANAAGKTWPAPILRGIAGDADAAPDIAALLEDPDVALRRKAAALLFALKAPATAPELRLALLRDEDETTRRYAAIALTRLGQGAPLVYELLQAPEAQWRRFAALALAETGDGRGNSELVQWWQQDRPTDFTTARELIEALAKIRAKDAAWPLSQALGDVRLRPYLARALAQIGEVTARGPLLTQLGNEPYHSNRGPLIDALLQLGTKNELLAPLRRFLGVPDPLEEGVREALAAGLLDQLGGPAPRDLKRLIANASIGERVRVVVPKGDSEGGLRLVARAHNAGSETAWLRVGPPQNPIYYSKSNGLTYRKLSIIDPNNFLELSIPATPNPVEVSVEVPAQGNLLKVSPGRSAELVVVAAQGVTLEGFVIVPLAKEIPPPAPQPWAPPDDSPASRGAVSAPPLPQPQPGAQGR